MARKKINDVRMSTRLTKTENEALAAFAKARGIGKAEAARRILRGFVNEFVVAGSRDQEDVSIWAFSLPSDMLKAVKSVADSRGTTPAGILRRALRVQAENGKLDWKKIDA